jgi:hypothetical protein
MKKILALALGILSAIGGFVDIGDFVFNSQAGAHFGYALLWAVLVGVAGIAIYSEMCGRVASASRRGVFDLIRERLGYGPGLITLVGAQLINVLTLAAEIGGVAIVLQLILGPSYRVLAPAAVLVIGLCIWFLPFGVIERLFSYLGLSLVIFLIVAVRGHPDVTQLAHGLVPNISGDKPLLFSYFAVGIVGEQLTRHVRRRRVRGRRVGDWVRAVRGVDRGRRARPRRQAAPRAPGLLAGDRARLAPTGAAPRRVPLPLPDGAGSRAGVRRRPAARGRGREPVPPTPGTETCGGTLARAG